MRIVFSHDVEHDSQGSTLNLDQRGGASDVMIMEDRTVISQRSPSDIVAPPIHIGPLDSRKALEGETLDHFLLETFVGGGGMGAVYRGFDTRLNRAVAVKVLSRDQADAETVRRFRNEAQSAARLDHPHISRVYYIGEDKGWNFIVFEFIEGINLRDLVERHGPMALNQALGYTLQIAEALDHAQSRDVVHRDIKPSNILVANEGGVKLVDMGLARLHQVHDSGDDLTASGVTLGTFDYISPEQARDPRTADVRSDLYSLGCTLYFTLTGRPPFPDGTALQKLLRHNADEPPDVRLFRPDVPDGVTHLLGKLMAKKPEARFQSASEFVGALLLVAQRYHLEVNDSRPGRLTVAPQIVVPAAPWWQSLAPLLIPVIILLVVAFWPTGNASPSRVDRLSSVPHASMGPTRERSEAPSESLDRTTRPTPATPNPSSAAKVESTTNAMNKPMSSMPKSRVSEEPGVEKVVASEAVVTTAPPIGSERSSRNTPEVVSSKSNKPELADVAITPEPKPKVETPTAPSPVEPMKAITPATTAPKSVVVKLDATSSTSNASASAVVVDSLPAALTYVAANPEVKVIELAFNRSHTLFEPVVVSSSQLTIRAALGFAPELVFRATGDSPRDAIIRLTGVAPSLSVENVKLEVRTSSPLSVFEVPHDGTLDLADCAVTYANGSSDPLAAAGATLIHCPADPQSLSVVADDEASLPEPPVARVSVRRSILRGDATLCRLPEDHAVRLNFTESFLATTSRLLESGGLAGRPRWMDRMRVALQRCTVVAPAGLMLAGSRVDQTQRMEMRVNMESSLVITDKASPLIEYRGGDAGDEARLSFEGSDNFYPRTLIFFRRVLRQDGTDETFDSPLGDIPRWAHDRNAEQGALASLPTDYLVHELDASQFVLKSPLEGAAGCNLALLPAVESTRRTATTTSTMENSGSDLSGAVTPPIMNEKVPRTMMP